MNRGTSITPLARAMLFFVVVLIAGNGKGFAQEADVKAAVNAYHAAIGALDMPKLETLWVHDNNVTLINPRSKSISVGWDAVKKDWESTLGGWSELKVTQADGPHIQVDGNVAWSTGIASVVGKSKSGEAVNAPTFETDVFEKRGSQWLLVSHAAWRVPQ